MDPQLDTAPEARARLPLNAKIAAIYLIVAGITSIPFLFSPQPAQFAAKTVAYRSGYYARQVLLDAAFIVAGVATLRRRPWARKLAVIVLIISGFYGAFDFARGMARGAPPPKILLFGFILVGIWNGIWIYLLCRRGSQDATPDA
jgi:hypothetical protein